jgi:hypothetical protein
LTQHQGNENHFNRHEKLIKTKKVEDHLKLRDLIDVNEFQKLMDRFFSLTGIPIGIIDTDNNVLIANGWQDICTRFHRKNPDSLCNCIESDQYITSHLLENKGSTVNLMEIIN